MIPPSQSMRWRSGAAWTATTLLVISAAIAVSPAPRASAVPAPGDISVAADVPTAQAAAAREGHRVEVRDLEQAASTTFVNSDGTWTTEQSASRIRVEKNGALVDVDPSLATSADGSVRPTATDLLVTLSGGGNQALATVGMGEGSVTYGWPSVLPKPAIAGATATYADVLPNTDLTVTVSDQTIETSYVIKSKPDSLPGPVSMPVALNGVTAQADGSGAVTYHDADSNAVVGQSAAATTSDSSEDPASDSPVTVQTPSTLTTPSGAALPDPTVQPDNNTVVQKVSMPASILSDPDTVYPVVVDPEVTDAAGESAYAYVNSAVSNQSYFNTGQDGSRLHMGKDPTNGSSINRALWYFVGMSPLANPQTNVLNASFSAGLSWTSACAPQPVDLYDTGPWGSNLTWNNQPPAAGPFASATPPSANTTGCGAGHSQSSVGFDVTAIIRGQKANSRTDLSIELRAHDENNSDQWQKWNWNATLSYTYVATPNPVTNPGFLQPSVPCVSQAPYPIVNSQYLVRFQGTYSTPDRNTTINAGYIVTNVGDTSTWLWATNNVTFPNNSSSYTDITPNQSWEQTGSTYRLETYAWQNTSYGNVIGPSTYCYFTIDNSTPPAPTLQSPTPSSGTVTTDAGGNSLQMGKPVTFTFGLSSGTTDSSHITGVRYQFNSAAAPDIPGAGSHQWAGSGSCAPSATTAGSSVAYVACVQNGAISFTVTPPDDGNYSLYVQTVNQAGTLSPPASLSGAAGTGIPMAAQANPYAGSVQFQGAQFPPWHFWSPTASPAPDQGNITNTSLAQRSGDSATPLVTSNGTFAPPAAGSSRTPNGNALGFASTPPAGAHGGTAAMASIATNGGQTGIDVNWANGFSVGAWVNPASSGSNWQHAVISQDGQNDSRFILRESVPDSNSAVHWEFCVTNDAPAPSAIDCVDSVTTVTPNTWTFVAGTWDPIAKRIRVTAATAGSTLSPSSSVDAASTAPLGVTASGGPLIVGRAQWSFFGGAYDSFAGTVADVFFAPAPMTTGQAKKQMTSSSH